MRTFGTNLPLDDVILPGKPDKNERGIQTLYRPRQKQYTIHQGEQLIVIDQDKMDGLIEKLVNLHDIIKELDKKASGD